MKKILTVISAALMLLTSCGGPLAGLDSGDGAEKLSGYISSEPLALSGVKLHSEPQSVAAYKNIVFSLHDGSIDRIDLISSSSTAVAEVPNAIAVGCDGSHFAVAAPSAVYVYDYDGGEIGTVSFETEISEIVDVAVRGNTVAIAGKSGNKCDVYLADLKDKTATLLPDTWKCGSKSADVMKISLASKNTVQVIFLYNGGIAGSDCKAVEYDADSDEILLELPADYNFSSGCFGTDGEIYCPYGYISGMKDDTEWHQFISKMSREGDITNVMLVDNEGLRKIGIKPKETHTITDYEVLVSVDSYFLEYADGENFVLWDKTAGTIAAFNADTGLESVVVLAPGNNDVRSWISRKIKDIAVKYTASTGRQVIVKNYSEEEYDDRLRTKLLAGDSDFDIFISDDVLLYSVLENSAYYPLDEFEGIAGNFDNVLAQGVREMMTDDAGLFGVPLRLNYWGCLKETEESGIPENWTIDDMFDFCDRIPDGKKVFGDRYMLNRTVFNVVEDMIAKNGKIDKEKLSETLAKLKEYNDRGVLCDGDREGYLTYGILFYDISVLENDVGSYRTIVNPTASGTNYFDIEYTLMMNHSCKNKEVAAEFMELFTTEDYVYQNDDNNLIIGKDVERNSCWAELDDAKKEVLRYSMEQYKNVKPSALDAIDGLSQIIVDELFAVFDGEKTPDEAAQKITDEVAYIYFE